MTRLAWLRERGMGASILVAGLSSAFGVVLIAATGYISAFLFADPFIGGSETLAIVVGILTVLLVGVAVYVAAIVTANTFATIVAGRVRNIALMRLIGASGRSQRTQVARQGLVVGGIGAFLGLLVGTGVAAAGVAIGDALLDAPTVPFALVQPSLLLPAAIVALTTWAAAWSGSRRVLSVTPLEALGGSAERAHEDLARRPGRNIAAISLFAVGGALLALGAALVMPPVLRLVGRVFGSSATARLAAENGMRHPERSSRMAIGVVMGVTLVTMFAVAIASTKAVLTTTAGGELPEFMATLLDTFSIVMMALVGVSAVIAAVGLVNLLTIGVVQRRRELGLLRALGLSNGQVRRMILLEATHVTVAALALGLVLGVAYGWAGAQSLLGSVPVVPGGTAGTFVLPELPLVPLAVVVVATAILTLVAAVVPTRLATRVAPVEALVE